MKPFSCPLYVSHEKYHYILILKNVLQYTLISLLPNEGKKKSEKKSTFKRRPFLVNGSKVFDFNKKHKLKMIKTDLFYFSMLCFLGPEYTKKV